jgi:hypothetical protein
VSRLTREGFEYQTGVNYLGHVQLAKRLIEGFILRKVPLQSHAFTLPLARSRIAVT